MRTAVALLAMVCATSIARAEIVPLPRPRPPQAGPAIPVSLPAPSEESVAKPRETAAGPSACEIALKDIAQFLPLPPLHGPGGCGATDVVRLDAVVLPDRAQVALDPPAVLRCTMATAVSHWLREDVAPKVAALGAPLRGIENYDSYDCRGRNRVFGAKLSEHGKANALDIRAVKLATGAVVHLTDPHVLKSVRDAVRASACGRFMTVLGPGSDGYHEEHIHVDLAERRNDFRMCQWEVRLPLDRAEPSPPILTSRAPTPHEMLPLREAMPASAVKDRRAAGGVRY